MNRKELVRQYKAARGPIGVYRVRNRASDKSLVGASIDLPAILNRHRAQLRMGAHQNRALQRDWNALGADAFAFEILDTLAVPDRPDYDPSDDLRVLEELWLQKLSPFGDRGYNVAPKS